MSDKPRAAETKARLIDAAIRLLSDGGPEALQARKLAAEVGASTMAVYTHFGGMGALVDAVAREGFLRLSAQMARVAETDDPVADLFALALAYRRAAVENPQLFAVTFGQSAPSGQRATLTDLTSEEGRSAPHEGIEAFGYLLRGAERAIEAGRFKATDPLTAAFQLWSALHGFVTLETSGHFGTTEHGVDHVLSPLSITLAVGLGDSPEAAKASSEAAITGWREAGGNVGGPCDDVQVTGQSEGQG
ncbi:TetR/AcrR family transcriptional regulator [Amycolatopsis sp. NPDC059021]|uniref:TetR/AcrR family transcriptional regulator n=1 Tax=Amycolatopsis sp. NPDC059021 TaxID=3346704 RepID=UPI00366FDD98